MLISANLTILNAQIIKNTRKPYEVDTESFFLAYSAVLKNMSEPPADPYLIFSSNSTADDYLQKGGPWARSQLLNAFALYSGTFSYLFYPDSARPDGWDNEMLKAHFVNETYQLNISPVAFSAYVGVCTTVISVSLGILSSSQWIYTVTINTNTYKDSG
jgi:hypothetical protein